MINEVRQSLDRIGTATDRLSGTVASLDDAAARQPSLLPGWSRGHVLTHIARNADGLANLLRWARTGTETPMYASSQARAAAIEAGSARPVAELAADLHASAAAFAAETARVPDEAWAAQVRGLRGPPLAARGVLEWRLWEVEIHHVDLAAGYRPADWPEEFVAGALPEIAASFAGRDDTPPFLLVADRWPQRLWIGPAQQGTPRTMVHGPPASALAWLIGRDDGAGLRVSGEDGTLPVLPPWR